MLDAEEGQRRVDAIDLAEPELPLGPLAAQEDGTRPYAHLREEFEHRLQSLRTAGDIPDPRDAQIERLKSEITKLKARLTRSDSAIEELTDFRTQALARLAAQHEKILHLRRSAAAADRVTRLPTARSTSIGSSPPSEQV